MVSDTIMGCSCINLILQMEKLSFTSLTMCEVKILKFVKPMLGLTESEDCSSFIMSPNGKTKENFVFENIYGI